jgi:hypothetical protein
MIKYLKTVIKRLKTVTRQLKTKRRRLKGFRDSLKPTAGKAVPEGRRGRNGDGCPVTQAECLPCLSLRLQRDTYT